MELQKGRATSRAMKIKELRVQRGMTQQQVADAMGVVRSAVANWGMEVALPHARAIPGLARLFHCSIDELFAAVDTNDAG